MRRLAKIDGHRSTSSAARGADRGGRRRARGRLPPDRRARARRRPAHGRARRHERHDRLVLLPGVRLAERVRRDPRQGQGRLLLAAPDRRRLALQAALLPGHERPHHALLHRPAAWARCRTSCRSRTSRSMHRHRLLRRVVVVRGAMEFELEVQPRFDYGREEHEVEMHPHGVLFRAPSLTLALEGAIAKSMGGAERALRARRPGRARDASRSQAGESQTFVLERVPADHICRPVLRARDARRVRGDGARTGAAGWSSRATAAAGARWCTARRSR